MRERLLIIVLYVGYKTLTVDFVVLTIQIVLHVENFYIGMCLILFRNLHMFEENVVMLLTSDQLIVV